MASDGEDVFVGVRLERIEVEEQVVGMRDVLAPGMQRMHLDAAEVRDVEQRRACRRPSGSRSGRASSRPSGPCSDAPSPACGRAPSSRRSVAPPRRRASASSSAAALRGAVRSGPRCSSSRRGGRPSCTPRRARRPCPGSRGAGRVRPLDPPGVAVLPRLERFGSSTVKAGPADVARGVVASLLDATPRGLTSPVRVSGTAGRPAVPGARGAHAGVSSGRTRIGGPS